jgi:hypothetical protein
MTRARQHPALLFALGIVAALGVLRGGSAALANTPDAPPAMPPETKIVSGELNFELDVMPVLSAAGCNTGACHGKARGQNGFALSLLGFDPAFDYSAIVEEGHGRRVFPAAPDNSLLLRKAALRVPHGGGERLKPGSEEYETIRLWIASGMPRASATAPTLDHITVEPPEHVMPAGSTEQLKVLAHYSDGSVRDVTRLTDFTSNEPGVVSVKGGLVTAGQLPGEATLTIRYMNHIVPWNTAIPIEGSVDAQVYQSLPRRNFIDELVWEKLATVGIVPSPPAPDHTFLRRADLDVIGRLPTPEETRKFLADSSPSKREELIDALLARPEYADYWANKWADLLRPNPYRVGIKPTMAFDAWIREAFRENRPYDQFVRQLVMAQGSAWHNGAATWFRDRRTPDEITTAGVCQVPPPSVRGLGPGRFLWSGGLLCSRGTQRSGHLAADFRGRRNRAGCRVGIGAAPDHQAGARAQAVVRPGPAHRSGRRSAGGAGRLDHGRR